MFGLNNSGGADAMDVCHLPYVIEPDKNRQHYYETHWKIVGLQLLARHLKPQGSTLLDYGCGRGEAMEIAKQMGFDPQGADADPSVFDWAPGMAGPSF